MAVPKSVTFYQLNTQFIEIDGLQNPLDLTYFTAATVTATLTDSTGTAVAGVNNLSLGFVPATNGNYRGTVAATFNPPVGTGYTLTITAIQGSVQLQMTIKATVAVRIS